MLELHADAPAIYLERLRLADGSPMCLETIWLPGRPFPNLLELDMEQSIYDLLWTRYRTRIDSADQRISATIADERTRDLLGMTDPSATIVISRRSFDNKGRVIEFAISRYHADRYDFAVTVHR
jgi:GntR family transcriptional regulator